MINKGDDDFEYYRENLIFFKKHFGLRIYAYCLMNNHIHIFIDHGMFSDGSAKGLPKICFRKDTGKRAETNS